MEVHTVETDQNHITNQNPSVLRGSRKKVFFSGFFKCVAVEKLSTDLQGYMLRYDKHMSKNEPII